MNDKKKMIPILAIVVALSFVGLIGTISLEKNMNNYKATEEKKPKIQDEYYEKAKELGIEEATPLLPNIDRSVKKIDNDERAYKLASDILSDFRFYIETRQLEKAYSMLNQEYIQDFGMTYEVFKAQYEDYKTYKYVIISIKNLKSNYEAVYLRYFEAREDGYVKHSMSVIKGKTGEYSIALNGLTEATQISKENTNEGLKISVVKRYFIGDRIGYKVVLENTTESDIYIANNPEGIYGILQDKKITHKIANSNTPTHEENYHLRAGEIKKHIIEFNVNSPLQKLGIILASGNEVEVDLIISE
jgi:hypothetical protein